MFLKSVVVVLLVALAVVSEAGVIYEAEESPSEYQLSIGQGSDILDSEPLLIHLRPRRQAQEQKRDRGSVGADVSRGPDGTRVRADGQYNIHTSRDGRTTVDANAGYERTYRGPHGTSRPNYNVGVGFRHRF